MKKRNHIIKILIFFIPILLIIIARSSDYYVGINLSDSINKKIFIYQKNISYQPKIGDLIIFKVPKNDPYFGNKEFVKKIIGVKGDEISQQDREYTINKIKVRAKIFAKNGERLKNFNLKENTIPHNHYFVYSNHKDSYDSRYFGYVSRNQIIGHVVASI